MLLSVALFAWATLNFVFNLSKFQITDSGIGGSAALTLLQDTAVFVVAGVIAFWASGHLREMARSEDEGLNDRLLGYVVANDESKFDVLSTWIKLSERETVNRLAKIASMGKMEGYMIDLPNRKVIRSLR
jgi:hypothetical protein